MRRRGCAGCGRLNPEVDGATFEKKMRCTDCCQTYSYSSGQGIGLPLASRTETRTISRFGLNATTMLSPKFPDRAQASRSGSICVIEKDGEKATRSPGKIAKGQN